MNQSLVNGEDPQFIFLVFHYPLAHHRDQLARDMAEMGAILRAKPGCLEVEPPYLTEDGTCLVGISKWKSKDAFLASGVTLGRSDQVFDGETRPRERFFLLEARPVPP